MADTPLAERLNRKKLVKRSANVESKKIGCPQCAAPIEIRNYDSSEMVSCQYCGAVLDLKSEDRQVVRHILVDHRPPSVLSLGARGSIKGCKWEVIGRTRLKASQDGEVFEWDEYLLFNPRRGYAWLSEDEGRWHLAKKMRHKPTLDPTTAQRGKRFRVAGENYVVAGREDAEVVYVEGEFTYHIEKGDRVGIMEAVSQSGRFECCAEWSPKEIHWTLGERIPPESIAQGFSVQVPNETPRDSEECPKYRDLVAPAIAPLSSGAANSDENAEDSSHTVLGINTFGWSMVFGLILIFLITFAHTVWSGERIIYDRVDYREWYTHRKPNAPGYTSSEIKLEEPTVLDIRYRAKRLKNDWLWLETEILDSKKDRIHYFTNEISYYTGPGWSEGSREDNTLVRIDKAGTYYINICGEGGARRKRDNIHLSIYKDVVLSRYFILLLSICLTVIIFTTDDHSVRTCSVGSLVLLGLICLGHYIMTSGVATEGWGETLFFIIVLILAIMFNND